MIDNEFVFKLIDGIAKRFEDEEEGCIAMHYTKSVAPGEFVEFFLCEEIKTTLKCLNVSNYIETTCIYEDDYWAFDAYAICISFIINGRTYRKFLVACDY